MFHCIEYIFTTNDFWATLRLPWKAELPRNFSLYWIHFLHSGFLSNLRLTWRTECALKVFTVWNIFFTIQDSWATCACPEKTELPWKFSLYWICIFHHSGILSNVRLTSKTELPWNFSPVLEGFLSFRIFEQLALALKTGFALKMSTVLNILFTFRSCEQFALALKKQRGPWIYRTVYVFFIIQDFWATCACPEKHSCPENFRSIEYVFFTIQEFWATCPEKQSCPGIFHLY